MSRIDQSQTDIAVFVSGSFSGSFSGSAYGSFSGYANLDWLEVSTPNIYFQVSGSGPILINASSSTQNVLLIGSGSQNYITVNNQGIFILTPLSNPPTPVSGGLYFDTSGNFFAGL